MRKSVEYISSSKSNRTTLSMCHAQSILSITQQTYSAAIQQNIAGKCKKFSEKICEWLVENWISVEVQEITSAQLNFLTAD